MHIDIDLSNLKEVINPVYYPLIQNQDRYLNLMGSAGSGKSWFICQKHLLRILFGYETKKKHHFAFFRKHQPHLRRSIFKLVKYYIEAWGLSNLVQRNDTEMVFQFSNGSTIQCIGLDDPEKLKSIEGLTGAWLEEATEFTFEDFMQIDLRLRGRSPSYKQICTSFNPISRNNWVYKNLFEKKLGTWLKTTYKDNIFLDEEYKTVLETKAKQDENYYRIYALGEWGELVGLIFPNWKTIPFDNIPKEYDTMRYGLDFGFNHPTALLQAFIDDKNKKLYLHELLYERGLTNNDLIRCLKNLIPNKNTEIMADSAEPARIEEIYREGFNIHPAVKGQGSVHKSIDKLNEYEVFVTSESANVEKERSKYKWKTDKNNQPLDEPIDIDDDAMAAARYAVNTKEELDICECF